MTRRESPETADPKAREARIAELLRARLGCEEVLSLTPLTAGARKETWSFEALVEGRSRPLIYQRAVATGLLDPDDPWSALPLLADGKEFLAMDRAARAGVPVPPIACLLSGEDALGDGAIMERLEGETLGKRIVRDPAYAPARARLAGQLGRVAAAVHAIEDHLPDSLAECPAERQLATYRQVIENLTHPHPALALGLAWAERHIPPQPERLCLVHGDFRLGNLIVGEEGLRAVLDWEIAHLGDPLEDLGYLCMKSWRFGGVLPVAGVGERAALYESYAQAGGGEIDPEAVRFWEVVGCMKWALSCLRRGDRALTGEAEALELAATGRKAEEPIYDLLTLIEETL